MSINKTYFEQFYNKETGKEYYALCRKDAENYAKTHSLDDCAAASMKWYKDETYYIQMWAVGIMGCIASKSNDVFEFLKDTVSRNSFWQVQECLASAFDNYCRDIGYKNSLGVIDEWIKCDNANTRRAVSEGLRVWTKREYFKENPHEAVKILSSLRNDESEYVRKSAGNALRDISKQYPEMIKKELGKWELNNKGIMQVYRLAGKLVIGDAK